MSLNKFNRDTERLVLDTALGLFREHGHDRTTMRAIATAAGISTGNAYYYFPSKQHLVQHFYAELQEDHRRTARPVLAGTTSLTRPRAVSVDLFREVLDGSGVGLDDRLRAELPELLWLAYLGLVLFWVHDASPRQARTRQLIDTAAPLPMKLLRLSRLPVLRTATADVLALVRAVRP